jgi:ferritin-like metal-binding protein YciE
MEHQAQEILERQIERSGDYPDVQSKLRAHLEETREQKRRLEECLKSLGSDTSMIKDAAMSLFGNMAAMTHAVAQDEIVKNALANNGLENYEVAAYKSLLSMCQEADEPAAVKNALETSLKEEEAMAAWTASSVTDITEQFIAKKEMAPA